MNKAKKIVLAFAGVAGLILSGCSGLTNLTPDRVPENSSRMYTLSMSAHINDGSIMNETVEPLIVVDEKVHKMKPAENMEFDRVYEFDYFLPKGRKNAKYYFMLKYKSNHGSNGIHERTMTSPVVYTLEPVTRYVVNMQTTRGSVGSNVVVLGRGFDKLDKIYIGGLPADTEVVSRSELHFTVPPLASGKNYDVDLVGQDSEHWLGQFRVDASEISVAPASLEIESGDFVTMVFSTGFKAPKGGYPIDVKTNIPSSIVMPEVVIPEGKTSVSVQIKGAVEGEGKLFINSEGFEEKTVSVKVSLPDSGAGELSQKAKEIDSSIKQ